MSYHAETIAEAVMGLLEDNLAAALDTVATEWGADPVSLGDVATWLFGHHPTVLERAKTAFPIVSVIAGNSSPTGEADQFVLATSLYEFYVDVFVAAESTTTVDAEELVSKKLLRYVEAVFDVLAANMQISSIAALRTLPAVEISEVARQYTEGRKEEFFTQWARLTMQAEA